MILGRQDLWFLNRYLVVCETGRIQAALIAMIYRVKLHAESSEKAESTIRELKQNMIFGQRHRRILNGLSWNIFNKKMKVILLYCFLQAVWLMGSSVKCWKQRSQLMTLSSTFQMIDDSSYHHWWHYRALYWRCFWIWNCSIGSLPRNNCVSTLFSFWLRW